ncbi:Uncharacterized protein AC501_3567 [Pseudomonas amygdali pv. lachrymans]|nr:Uncharacterized protein AC501_3567 [Pseudomonas amygdali pv. lachrymans]
MVGLKMNHQSSTGETHMANSLTIILTEFKTIGSTETYCGYMAMDDEVEACCRLSETWEGFKSNYPTLESLLEQVMGEQVFEHLQASYTVKGLDIDVEENHGMCAVGGISVVGAELLYGPNAAIAACPTY